MNSIATILHGMRRHRSAVAAVEFGLMAPVWISLMVFTLDFAELFYLKIKLAVTVSTAASFAFLNAQMVTAPGVTAFLANVQTVGKTAANLGAAAQVVALFNNAGDNSNSANYYCVSGTSPVVFTSTGTSAASCGGSVVSGKFVTISVSGQLATFFAKDPILGATLSSTDNAVVRFE